MSILDDFQYPFHKPEAQQLHRILTDLYPNPEMARLTASMSGLDTSMIYFGGAPFLVWAEILRSASPQGMTRALVEVVFNRLSPNSPVRKFLQDLLADQPTEIDAEPVAADGSPVFLKDNDDVSDNEALLYHDDLMIQIGKVPELINTLKRLLELAPAVCKLTVDFNGLQQSGTGFRIGSDMLLTNWHVLHTEDNTRARVVTAEFGFDDNGEGGILTATPIACDVESIVTNKDDDWGVLRVKQPLLDAWPIVKLSESVAPELNMATYIIQHPAGGRKRVGFVRNQVSAFDDQVVHYLTDTKEGSSGAPVFNRDGQLVAVHHRGGRPQQLAGRSPLKKNEGIRASRIIAGLNAQGVTPL
jgi:V8-like Glu-specific endopeptidase